MTNDQIIQRLIPGWGKTTRPCETCDAGEVGYESGGPAGWVGRDCPDCDGHGEQFRDDAEGRAVIAEAVCKFIGPDGVYLVDQGWSVSHKPRIALGYWDNRRVKSWRLPLESHVRRYQRSAPDLRANDGRELKAALRAAGWSYVITWLDGQFGASVSLTGFGFAQFPGPTEADALFVATEAALGGNDAD